MAKNTDYEDGYQAGLNAWRYDLSKSKSEDYNDGWKKGWEKRQVWGKFNG